MLPYYLGIFSGLVGRYFDDSVNFLFAHSNHVRIGHPVYVAGGQEYSALSVEDVNERSTALRADLDTLPWLTYRKEFQSFRSSAVVRTSDKGWGCTMRSMQMLTASSLIKATLGSEFRRGPTATEAQNTTYTEIIKLFADSPSAQLSLHNMLSSIGGGQDNTGRWFGPSETARAISSLHADFVYKSDSAVDMYKDEIVEKLEASEGRGILILHSISLGPDKCIIDIERSRERILPLFKVKSFQGFVGGDCVSQSYFFPAASRDYLYILDPHTTQMAIPENLDVTNLEYFVPPQPGIMGMRWPRLSSSMTLGFFVANRADLEALEAQTSSFDFVKFHPTRPEPVHGFEEEDFTVDDDSE